MSYQYVNVEVIRKVAVIEFNYSRKLNALSKVFIDDLRHFTRAWRIKSFLRRP